jgi:two-component system, OmpR family, sensor histidine kinase QseC
MNSRARAPYSLKRRLLVALLAAVALVWLATAAYSYFDARHEVNRLLDAHLAQSASLIVAQVGHDLEEIELEHPPSAHERARRVAFQVWERGAVLRLHSANAPQERLSPREDGYSSVTMDGRTWRVFSTWDARHRVLVQVGERDEARREIAAGIAANLLIPLLVALPLLGLFVWLSIGRALEPLSRLGHEVEERRADSLGALAARDAPREVMPLVRSLNALFERVGRLVENERRFTADAAHELRTPLAALKTQAQVALGASDEAARRHALHSVIAGCDRATRLIEQLLTLARLDPGHAGRPAEACDLASLARQVIGELAPAALARNVEVELADAQEGHVSGYPDLVSVLLRNLVDNAVRYSPAGASVYVDVARMGDRVRIAVADQGPGIPPEERARVGQRFYRVLGTGQSGSGLGLSIVRRIAEIHSAELAFDSPQNGKGLRVTVTFPGANRAN